MGLIDAFTFYNEIHILEKRLELLKPYVDYFVLVEADKTHAGNEKRLYFNEIKDKFTMYDIRHVIVNDMPEGDDPWLREKYQRECILKGISELASDEDRIMISDVDEIPMMCRIPMHISDTIALHMYMFEYSLEYMCNIEPWIGTVITNVKDVRIHGPNFFRSKRWGLPIVPYCGWHCSSFVDVGNKVREYAHHREVTTDVDYDMCVSNGIHFDGTTLLTKTPSDVPLPW